jgi:hypothetical protein
VSARSESEEQIREGEGEGEGKRSESERIGRRRIPDTSSDFIIL